MKICAISDLHGKFKEVKIEPVDILFICGDIVPLSIQRSIPLSFEWYVINFIKWCQEQPAKQIYFVPGNHDFFLQNNENKAKKLLQGTNITVLYNEGAEYFDEVSEKIYTIWGSPNCHIFGNWAFMYSEEKNKEDFELMPKNLDFLITHDAPYGRNDVILQKDCPWVTDAHIGNIPLVEVVKEKKPRYHFTGHLHTTDHKLVDYDGTKTACVSLLDENYKLAYEPLYLEID